MGDATKIEWCDATFNPWVGCTKVSAACDHCYAESWAKRTGNPELWTGERRRTSESNWRQPIKWNRQAEAEGVRKRVFCASLADVFDNQVPEEWRHDLWELIAATRHLDWLVLTKRPQNIRKMLPVMDSTKPRYRPWSECWPWRNVWLGTTAEDQVEAKRRINHLLQVPAAVHFISAEPLLGPLDLRHLEVGYATWLNALDGVWSAPETGPNLTNKLRWVICGGESGGNARLMREPWAESLRDQCRESGTAFFMKQMTRKAPIPADLLVREFPRAA